MLNPSRLHRWSGLIACLGLLLWGSSGLMHPLMSRLQPQPVERQAPLPAQPERNLAALLASAGIDRIQGLHAVHIDGQNYLRLVLPEQADAVYLNADSGEPLSDGETRHAVFLARHFSGDQTSSIRSLERVDHFSPEYPTINRYLPVWQVRFERPDGLRVQVDTAYNRLGSQTDDRQVRLSTLFHQLHTWAWAEKLGPLRPLLMSLLLAAALLTAVLGLNLALRRPGGPHLLRQPLRHWHRHAALLVSCTTLSFAGSGLYHLWQKAELPAPPFINTPVFTADELQRLPALRQGESLSLLRLDGQAYWRVAEAMPSAGQRHGHTEASATQHGAHEHHGHHHHDSPAQAHSDNGASGLKGARFHHTGSGALAAADLEAGYAEALVRQFSGLATETITHMQTVTGFGPDYGFVNKRLPVVAVHVDTTGQDRWFVQTATGELAARNQQGHRLEAGVFAYVHKWHFLNISPALRDALQALFALGNVLVALLGFSLFLRGSRRQRTA